MERALKVGGEHAFDQIDVETGDIQVFTGAGIEQCDIETAKDVVDGIAGTTRGVTIGEIGRGFQQQMEQFIIERMFAAYSAVGTCDKALERTRAFVHERSVFGGPLASKQFVTFRLAELQAQGYR